MQRLWSLVCCVCESVYMRFECICAVMFTMLNELQQQQHQQQQRNGHHEIVVRVQPIWIACVFVCSIIIDMALHVSHFPAQKRRCADYVNGNVLWLFVWGCCSLPTSTVQLVAKCNARVALCKYLNNTRPDKSTHRHHTQSESVEFAYYVVCKQHNIIWSDYAITELTACSHPYAIFECVCLTSKTQWHSVVCMNQQTSSSSTSNDLGFAIDKRAPICRTDSHHHHRASNNRWCTIFTANLHAHTNLDAFVLRMDVYEWIFLGYGSQLAQSNPIRTSMCVCFYVWLGALLRSNCATMTKSMAAAAPIGCRARSSRLTWLQTSKQIQSV